MRIRTLLKYILFFLILIFASDKALYYMNADYFRIEKIESEGEKSITGAEMTEKIKKLRGQNIWYIDTNLIEKKLRNDVRIKNIKIRKVYPDTLKVDVEERMPYIYVVFKKKIYIADDEGIIYAERREQKPKNLLVIEVQNESEIPEIIKIIKKSENNFKLVADMVYVDEESVKILLRDGTIIKTNQEIDKKKYENGYKLYLKIKTEINKESFSYIDLRYADYVVK